MAGTIKITSLTDIGNTIPDTTLIPVVDMVGTPTTLKATFANIANAMLSEAGNTYSIALTSENANIANTAGTVTTNAQPNITSLGTLTSLTANGNVNLGAIGNVHITGGTNGYVLSTNGGGNLSWVALPTSGNIASINLDGNVSNVLSGNGTWVAQAGGLPLANGNSNIDISTSNGNVTITSNGIHVWSFTTDGDLVFPDNGTIGHSTPLGGLTVTSAGGDGVFLDASGVVYQFSSDGNLTLPGSANITNDIIVNGGYITTGASNNNLILTPSDGNVFIQLPPASNEDMNALLIAHEHSNGEVQIKAGTNTWNFYADGTLSIPDGANITATNIVVWTTAPVSNTSTGTAGQAAYDSGGNLYICVAANSWAKFAGTTSW